MTLKSSRPVESTAWPAAMARGARSVAAEVPVAFVYDGGAEAVMMATPADLEDFAVGFSLNERVVAALNDITELVVVEVERGIELRMTLRERNRDALVTRRRHRAGPVGCGLCGVESIAEALPPLPHITANATIAAKEIVGAMRALGALQKLNAETRAVHAAALYVPGQGVVAVREDIGRHNALDKLAGALARSKQTAAQGVVLVTSRLSVELVQKAAVMGAPIIAAVSAPTTLALSEAQACGITVAAIVRDDGCEIFTHPERITDAR